MGRSLRYPMMISKIIRLEKDKGAKSPFVMRPKGVSAFST